ncbi:phosphodiester glycosidase family protein [Desulfofalx alkaliphila]|uniref:phosphodiester glycosidase family protein n=1 Tax=Desulfofalx alkaliphila TaxID=105483 RepID=UPI0004E0CA5A|nr:phosphodiester glycosidase family protein [Desulfofalx alkaliphila]
MRLVNIFFAFLMAPVLALAIALYHFDNRVQAMGLPAGEITRSVEVVEDRLYEVQKNVDFVYQSILEQQRQYEEQQRILEELTLRSHEHQQLSDEIYEERILAMLGPPIETHRSERVEIKVFKLDELGYRGFIAKVKLFDPTAFRVVLAKDKLGEEETTGQAVQRTGAILGVNGGGFYRFMQNGRQYTLPIANTVIDGRLMNEFYPSEKGMFFAGTTRDGKVIGGNYFSQKELMAENPWQGVSFVPILIKEGKPLPLPREWQNTRHPRTIIGEYANGDLILIVVDGRQASWSSGVTLERLQIKLIELGVKEGYNLDGGGSSTFVYKGKVLNRPSDGRQRPMATHIVVMP